MLDLITIKARRLAGWDTLLDTLSDMDALIAECERLTSELDRYEANALAELEYEQITSGNEG